MDGTGNLNSQVLDEYVLTKTIRFVYFIKIPHSSGKIINKPGFQIGVPE